jgi:hypothetical protein
MAVRKKRKGRARKVIYVLFAGVFLVVISTSKFMLEDRLLQAKAKNESIRNRLEDEKNRAEELENLKLEIKTRKFIEETAREKFGLTYDNEIVFEPEK